MRKAVSLITALVEQASRLRRLGRAIVRGLEVMGQAHSGYPYI